MVKANCVGINRMQYIMFFQLRPSSPPVCLSITPFSLCSHHSIIIKFPPWTEVMFTQKFKVRGQRLSSQRSKQILPQFVWFRNLTPVWIDHIMHNSSEPQDCSTTQLMSSILHAWVVIEWPLQCLHYSLCTELQRMTKKTLNRRHF